MIKINKHVSNSSFENISDDYLIAKYISWNEKSNNPFYWRTGDFDKSLVEIGINDKTHVIFKVTIPMLDLKEVEEYNYSLPVKIKGVPICDVEYIFDEGKYQDEKTEIKLFRKKNDILICFSLDQIKMVYSSGDLDFCINNSNHLIAIGLCNFYK